MITKDQARSLLLAAWRARQGLPPPIVDVLEPILVRVGGALDGEVPRLAAAHALPTLAAVPHQQRASLVPGGDEAGAEEIWAATLAAVGLCVASLFDPAAPADRATLDWLGLAARPDDVARLLAQLAAHATAEPLPPWTGPLPDPYDDPLLSLVSYLKDQKREEERQELVGPAEAAMLMGPEPIRAARGALGLSFLRWRVGEGGIEALVRCRLHALAAEDWICIVPSHLRHRRVVVRSFLHDLRKVITGGPALDGLRHVRPPHPDAVRRLLQRLFAPSVLDEASERVVDFEERLGAARYLGGVVEELETAWPISPFKRLVREAGSAARALELIGPGVRQAAIDRYGDAVELRIDPLDETLAVHRPGQPEPLAVVRAEDWEP